MPICDYLENMLFFFHNQALHCVHCRSLLRRSGAIYRTILFFCNYFKLVSCFLLYLVKLSVLCLSEWSVSVIAAGCYDVAELGHGLLSNCCWRVFQYTLFYYLNLSLQLMHHLFQVNKKHFKTSINHDLIVTLMFLKWKSVIMFSVTKWLVLIIMSMFFRHKIISAVYLKQNPILSRQLQWEMTVFEESGIDHILPWMQQFSTTKYNSREDVLSPVFNLSVI